jgi:hypothetical protein
MILLAGINLMVPVVVQAQVAGSTLLGVTYGELRDVALGWSAKRQILGHPVYNNMDERIGEVEDIIVTNDKSISSAISMPAVSSRSRSTTSPFRFPGFN